MTNEITITAEQIEQLVRAHDKRNELYIKAYNEGRKETAKRHLDSLLGIEHVLDIIGIEYED